MWPDTTWDLLTWWWRAMTWRGRMVFGAVVLVIMMCAWEMVWVLTD